MNTEKTMHGSLKAEYGKTGEMEMEYVRFLENVTKQDFLQVGGKGANLGEMIAAGLPVPGGFVLLTAAYRKYVEANELGAKIDGLLQAQGLDSPKKLEQVSAQIQDLFATGEIPPELLEAIAKAYALLGGGEVAVRSSATAEDLPGTSFAGQYNTYLNVKGNAELCKYVKKCWASLWNYRALAYRVRHKIDNADLAHGVVVQAMINAKKSGILFTANPVNGRRDQMLLNASWGLGEAIVGGEVTPDQWVLAKEGGSIVEETVARKEVMTIRKDKGIEFVKVPPEQQQQVSLDHGEVSRLLQMGNDVEKYFGSPQDIEWAFKDGSFYLVQTRPITSLYPMPAQRNNKKGLRVFLNVNNYSQAMPEPFTPMGESIVRAMLGGVINGLGWKGQTANSFWWYQVLGGRIFVDITDFMRTERSWNKFKQEDGADKDPITTKALLQLVERNREEIINPRAGVRFYRIINLKLAAFLLKAAVKYACGIFAPVKAREKAVSLGAGIIERLSEEKRKLQTMEEKLDFMERNAGKMFLEGFGIIFYVAVSSTYIEKARKIMAPYLEDTSDLSYVEKSVPHSATTEMGMEILELAKAYDRKGRRPAAHDGEIQDFLAKYGHRNSIELDVGVPEWKEDPRYVLDLINTYLDHQNYQELLDRFTQGKVDAAQAIARIKARLEAKGQVSKARKVEKMLKDFREMFGIREQSKFFIRQLLSIYREIFLEIGAELAAEGRLADKHDIFYLSIDDLKKTEDLKAVVHANREKYNREFGMAAPRLLTSTGESIYAAKHEAGEHTLPGIAVSPGVYTGTVKILRSPEEGHKLEKGDILVTTGTNPAWTPLFLKLGALIMETGGPISHGSVVAREYGVPAVAGVAGATARIRDGQLVRVNGESGQVELLAEAKSQD